MSRKKIPVQVVRLVLLTAAIVIIYSIARYFLTPPSFGEYGFYRGAALRENADKPIHFAGQVSCVECHAEEAAMVTGNEHHTLSCETCHGPALAHVIDNKVSLRKISGDNCLHCHRADPSKPSWYRQIDLKDHYEGDCLECHVPHQPNEMP